LTEFANFIAIDMPAVYSSLGGQVKNPYAPALDDKGVPIVPPGGSSSGSAVAVAAGLCAAAIGTETSGSLLSPATQNGLVTVKPTVGLISRAGIVPIAHSQVRWTPPVGQSGGLDKLGSGCRQAAKFSIPDAQYASSGERPASIECGRRVL
jgi:Asp-tRNA(Asn)/Glu-tRNA(Gln) amidotransferase A subunit family amidase